MRYTDCPNVTKTNGVWPACGINEANVAMTATETVTSNSRVLGADPLVRYQPKKGRGTKEVPGGIGEEDLVTLVTCTPYGINTHRLLVRGHRVETVRQAKAIRVPADAVQIDPTLVAPVVAAPMLLILLLILLLTSKKRPKSR